MIISKPAQALVALGLMVRRSRQPEMSNAARMNEAVTMALWGPR